MKDNVYEETTLSNGVATESDGEGRENTERKQLVLGKFKDVDALARAYEALQAEFTRRSQRLKVLEQNAENSAKEEDGQAHLGVEKLRKNAQVRKEQAKRFDEFLLSTEEVGGGQNAESECHKPLENVTEKMEKSESGDTMYEIKSSAEETETTIKENAVMENVCMENAVGNAAEELEKKEQTGGALPFVAESENAAVSAENLYEQVSKNENVRLRIIGEYLNSIGKPNAPLMAGGLGAMKTPPKKANCITDAGNMALLYFQKSRA